MRAVPGRTGANAQFLITGWRWIIEAVVVVVAQMSLLNCLRAVSCVYIVREATHRNKNNKLVTFFVFRPMQQNVVFWGTPGVSVAFGVMGQGE